jgi:hypothetical protein
MSQKDNSKVRPQKRIAMGGKPPVAKADGRPKPVKK